MYPLLNFHRNRINLLLETCYLSLDGLLVLLRKVVKLVLEDEHVARQIGECLRMRRGLARIDDVCKRIATLLW